MHTRLDVYINIKYNRYKSTIYFFYQSEIEFPFLMDEICINIRFFDEESHP